MPEGRASTGSEPRRFRLSREPDDGRIVAYQHAGDRLDYGHILEVQEVVERDHDERAEDTPRNRAITALQAIMGADGFWDSPLAEPVSRCHAALARFNLTEGRDDG